MSPNHRVLVLAYYFPPMGLSGVQRVAKLVKYLPAFGWQPEVLTTEPHGYFAFDDSLQQEMEAAEIDVHRVAGWDPTRLFGRGKTVGLPGEQARRWWQRLSQAVFVPDTKVGWLGAAVRRGRALLETGRFDAIFSTAPPYTSHLVGARLQRLSGLPLVLDYRDDWLDNPRQDYATPLHRRLHAHLERRAFHAADLVLTINAPIRQRLEARGGGAVEVLPQGYDPEDFPPPPDVAGPAAGREAPSVRGGRKMQWLYSGIFYDAQTPEYFLRGLARAAERRPAFREAVEAVFVGLLPEASKDLARRLGIPDLVRHEGYLDHAEAVKALRAADVLWMTVGEQPGAALISTSKLYEYFGARKPILALVPDGAAQQAVDAYGAGVVVHPEDVDGIAGQLLAWHEAWRADRLPSPHEAFVRRHDRRQLSGALAGHLDALHARRHAGSLTL